MMCVVGLATRPTTPQHPQAQGDDDDPAAHLEPVGRLVGKYFSPARLSIRTDAGSTASKGSQTFTFITGLAPMFDRVINQSRHWWDRPQTRIRCLALLVLTAVFGINVVLLPIHVAIDHHRHCTTADHVQKLADHGGACQSKCPDHDAADHDLLTSPPLAPVIAPVFLSTSLLFIVPPSCPPVQMAETCWFATTIGSDRSSPGLSRAPPV